MKAIAFRGDDVIQRIDQQRSRVEPDGRAEVTGLAGVLEGGNVTPQYAVVQGDVQLVDPQRIAVWRERLASRMDVAPQLRERLILGVVGPEHEGEGIAPDRLRGAPCHDRKQRQNARQKCEDVRFTFNGAPEAPEEP